MSFAVCGGASLMCSFGMAPSVLTITPQNKVSHTLPLANIMDHKPTVNIMPFGMCTTCTNPAVAAATSAALGVLTPMPCIPNTVAPWTPGSAQVMIANMPALNSTSKLMCLWGGMIQITNPGVTNIMVP